MALLPCILAPSLGVQYRIVTLGAAPSDALQPWLDVEKTWLPSVNGNLDQLFADFHQEALDNGLPRFESETDLRADSVWSEYFMKVYGEVPSGPSNYPIKVRKTRASHSQAQAPNSPARFCRCSWSTLASFI